MVMMRFNRWLSSSSFSFACRFFDELRGGSSIAIASASSTAPIAAKFLKADFAGLRCVAIEAASGAASAVTTGAGVASCLAGFALSANTAALGKKS
jgi:hypothetical protein